MAENGVRSEKWVLTLPASHAKVGRKTAVEKTMHGALGIEVTTREEDAPPITNLPTNHQAHHLLSTLLYPSIAHTV